MVKLKLWELVIVFNKTFWSATNLCLRYASAKCAGNLPFWGIVFCNLGTSKTVISKFVTTQYCYPIYFRHLAFLFGIFHAAKVLQRAGHCNQTSCDGDHGCFKCFSIDTTTFIHIGLFHLNFIRTLQNVLRILKFTHAPQSDCGCETGFFSFS